MPRLIGIVDPAAGPWPTIAAAAATAVDAGWPAVMIRDRSAPDEALLPFASRLAGWSRRAGALLLLNRRPELAERVRADGLHLGASDVGGRPERLAGWKEALLHRLGSHALLGYSAHGAEEARAALAAGADYVLLSPIWSTASKPGASPLGTDGLCAAVELADGPVLALGGVTSGRLAEVAGTGAHGAAMIRGLLVPSTGTADRAREILRRTAALFPR